ncbi:hypothetical protein ACQP2X_33640 [Actinoplanes sp. CA-131856]
MKQGSGVTRSAERSFKGAQIRKPEAKDGHFAARVTSGIGGSFDNVYVIEFSDFGLSVELQAPPAAEVIDVDYVDPLAAGFW